MDNKTQADRMEEMLLQLVRNVGGLRAEFTAFKQEILEFREKTEAFQEEVTVRLDRIETEQKAMKEELVRINQRLDFQLNRIGKAEEEIHLLKLGKSS
jgi:hypothetical protein